MKHVQKAASQLLGANKRVRRGLAISDIKGKMIKVDRIHPAHLIILIPDLSLLELSTEDWMPLYHDVMEASGGFVHLLDPVELLRLVQAARAIARAGELITPMMAFDSHLIRRAEHVIKAGHPRVTQLLRMEQIETPQNRAIAASVRS